MTELKGLLHRVIQCHGVGPVVVTLDGESKRIGFREKGCHRTHWIPVMTAFTMAIRAGEEPPAKRPRR